MRAVCTVPSHGVVVVQASPGLCGSAALNAEFVRLALWRYRSWPFKFVLFHHPQNALQTGDKTDDAGWEIYEVARRAGALVINGHNHGYSRTKVLSNFRTQSVALDQRTIRPGRSAAIVSALGGGPIHVVKWARVRAQKHWAAVHASSHGVLLCDLQHSSSDDAGQKQNTRDNGHLHCQFDTLAPAGGNQAHDQSPRAAVDSFTYRFPKQHGSANDSDSATVDDSVN